MNVQQRKRSEKETKEQTSQRQALARDAESQRTRREEETVETVEMWSFLASVLSTSR